MAISKTNFDVFELTNGEVWMWLSSRWYDLSKNEGESHARQKLPKGVEIQRKVGSLFGLGPALPVFFDVLDTKFGVDTDGSVWGSWRGVKVK